jgi:hypothetical protein
VPPQLRKRLDDMRAQLSSRDATTRQLTTRALVEGDALHGVGLITILICWALFGGVGLYVAFDHKLPLKEFLSGGKPAEQWWLLWSVLVGFSLSLAMLEFGVARIRGLSAAALPAPPAADGLRPRCRYCAAELPEGTALRRCSHCQSDNLVISGRYLRAEEDVDRALDKLVAGFDTNLQKRIDTGDTIAMTGGVGPFFLLFIGPAVGLITPGNPKLWLVPAITSGLAVLLALYARLRRLPVEALELVTLGDKVFVRGEDNPSRIVGAQLMLESGPVSLFGKTAEEARMGTATARPDGKYQLTVYRVKPGQRPLAAGEADQLVTAELWRHNPKGPPTIDRVNVLFDKDGWRTFAGEDNEPHLQGFPSGKPPVIVVQ